MQDIKLQQFDDTSLTPVERKVFIALNEARTHPEDILAQLKEMAKNFQDNTYYNATLSGMIETKEGVKAVQEAMAFMKLQQPLPPLLLSKGLTLAARDHVEDQQRTGATGHTGSDGSNHVMRINRYGNWVGDLAGENIEYAHDDGMAIILALIVDDGEPTRGHRTAIFTPSYTKVGVGYGQHPSIST